MEPDGSETGDQIGTAQPMALRNAVDWLSDGRVGAVKRPQSAAAEAPRARELDRQTPFGSRLEARSTVTAKLGGAYIAFALLLAAWWLHWRTFAPLELGQDGYLSLDLALSPLREMMAFSARDVHPPLFYALLHWWLGVAGVKYVQVKYLPIASSVLVLAVLFRTGRLLLPARTTVIGLLILGLSPSYLLLSSTVRDYSTGLLFSLLSVLATLMLVSAKRETRRTLAWCSLLTFSTAAALLTWYFHPFFVVLELLLSVCASKSTYAARLRKESWCSRRSIAPIFSLMIGAVIALPWYVYYVYHQHLLLAAGATARDNNISAMSGLTTAIVGADSTRVAYSFVILWLLPIALGMYALFWRWTRDRKKLTTVFLLLVGGLFFGFLEEAVLAIAWSGTGTMNRYILAVLPITALIQALAVTYGSGATRVIAALSLLAIFLPQAIWFHSIESAPPIAWGKSDIWTYLDEHRQPGDAVVFTSRAERAEYLLSRGNPPLVSAVIESQGPQYLRTSKSQASAIVSTLARHVSRFWFVETNYPLTFPHAGRLALAQQAYPLWQQDFGMDSLFLLVRSPSDQMHPIVAVFGQVITLRGVEISRPAPGLLAVRLQWMSTAATSTAYTVFVHVDDPAGHLVAQQDGQPVMGLRPTSTWVAGQVIEDRHAVALPANVPPATYTIHVGLYKGQQRLTLPDGTNQVSIGVVTLRAPTAE